MKLYYYLNINGNKTYTLKTKSPSGNQSKPAHYKFIKIGNTPKNKI